MRKEILFAIIGGVLLGLVVAFGILRANTALTSDTGVIVPNNSANISIDNQNLNAQLSLLSPENMSVQMGSSTIVKGISSDGSWIVINGEDEDYIAKTDSSGSFEEEINLISGLNEFVVNSFDQSGNKSEKRVSVIYSSQFTNQISKEDEENNDEESENDKDQNVDINNEIDEVVQEKLMVAKSKAVAFIGGVTDKTESTIQTTSESGEIELITISEETTFVSSGKTVKTVSFEDLAIGDYVIAMGFKNESGVLEAGRILITTKPESNKYTSVMGTVLENEDGDLEIKSNDGSTYQLDTEDKFSVWTIDEEGNIIKSKFSNINEGDILIAAGILDGDTITARTIQITSPVSEEEN